MCVGREYTGADPSPTLVGEGLAPPESKMLALVQGGSTKALPYRRKITPLRRTHTRASLFQGSLRRVILERSEESRRKANC